MPENDAFGELYFHHADGTKTPVQVAAPEGQADHGSKAPASPAEAALTARIQELNDRLAAEQSARAAEASAREAERQAEAARKQADAVAAARADAVAFAEKAVADLKLMPAGVTGLAAVREFLALASAGLPTGDVAAASSGLDALLAAIPAHTLAVQQVPAGGKLPDGQQALPQGTAAEGLGEARKNHLLSLYTTR